MLVAWRCKGVSRIMRRHESFGRIRTGGAKKKIRKKIRSL